MCSHTFGYCIDEPERRFLEEKNSLRKSRFWDRTTALRIRIRPDAENIRELKELTAQDAVNLLKLAQAHLDTFAKLQPPRHCGRNDQVPMLESSDSHIAMDYIALACLQWPLEEAHKYPAPHFYEDLYCARKLVVTFPPGSLSIYEKVEDAFCAAVREAIVSQWEIEPPQPWVNGYDVADWMMFVTSAYIVFNGVSDALGHLSDDMMDKCNRRDCLIWFVKSCCRSLLQSDGLYFLITGARDLFPLVEATHLRIFDDSHALTFVLLRESPELYE